MRLVIGDVLRSIPTAPPLSSKYKSNTPPRPQDRRAFASSGRAVGSERLGDRSPFHVAGLSSLPLLTAPLTARPAAEASKQTDTQADMRPGAHAPRPHRIASLPAPPPNPATQSPPYKTPRAWPHPAGSYHAFARSFTRQSTHTLPCSRSRPRALPPSVTSPAAHTAPALRSNPHPDIYHTGPLPIASLV